MGGSYTGLLQAVNTDLRCMAVAPEVQGCLICFAAGIVEVLVKALLNGMYVASRRNLLIAVAFWIFLMSGCMISVYFIFVFSINTSVEQQRALMLAFIYVIFQRLIMQPAWGAVGTIWIIRSCTCERADMAKKVEVGDGSMVKTALSRQDDSWEDEVPIHLMRVMKNNTEPVSMKRKRDDTKDGGPGSRMNGARAKPSKTEARQKDAPAQAPAPNKNDEQMLEKHTNVKTLAKEKEDEAATNTQGRRHKKKQMRPGLAGQVAKERSGQKGVVVVNNEGTPIPIVGKELTGKTQEHAAAAKIQKTAEKQRDPSGEVAEERSENIGKRVRIKKKKGRPAVGKQLTGKTQEHAAAAKIQKPAEKQRVPGGEVAEERSEKVGKTATNKKGRDRLAVGKQLTSKTQEYAAAAKIQKTADKQRVPGGEVAEER